MVLYILKDNVPIPVSPEEAFLWDTSGDNRRVARDEVGEYTVSTVFLMQNQGWVFKSSPPILHIRPILFETLVSSENSQSEHDDYMERYCTWDEAYAGHQRICENLRNNKSPNKYID